MRLPGALLLLLAIPGPVLAQAITSPAPDAVSVAIYRAPGRSADTAMQLSWLRGYALVTERRTVTIPRGRATIRFEGVAAGILPESAIVTGLPTGVREKNLDADLLDPRSLYARIHGRPVTLRRQYAGRTIEEEAIIRSGADGAAIVETARGFEAIDCGPSDDDLVYRSVPPGLSAKPTLSVETDSPGEATATLTLTYLAWGFDWQANYVATLRPDGAHADLFAWVTLASGDTTSFAGAETMVVAGNVRRKDGRPYVDAGGQPLALDCFFVPIEEAYDVAAIPPPPPPPPPMMAMAPQAEAVVVTAMRARKVTQEELGDLKLYRVPEPTTVAAMSQKQVALLDKDAVPVDVVHRSRLYDDALQGPVAILLRAQNRTNAGLGLPLPAGPVAVFAPAGAGRFLIGQGATEDKAVGEEVEVEIATASQVTTRLSLVAAGKGWTDHELVVTNANPYPVRFEAEMEGDDRRRRLSASAKLGRKNGRDLWAVAIPANASRSLRFRLAAPRR